jgi:ABC-type multidrug transport system ATPase subunit
MTAIDLPAASSAQSALTMRGIHKSFGRGLARAAGRTCALFDVDIALSFGEILCVAGAESSGKTALLQCAAGLLKCDAGSVEWFGQPIIAGIPVDDVAYVSSTPVYYPFLTLRDVIVMASSRQLAPEPGLSWSAREILALLELDLRIDCRVADLSRGELRALSLAEALVRHPLGILLDTAASESRFLPRALIVGVKDFAAKGGATIIAVRDAVSIAEAATRIVVLHEGTIRRSFYWDAVPPTVRLSQAPLLLAETLH